MRCHKYKTENKVYHTLPSHLEKDGLMILCIPANFERLSVKRRVDATPAPGKIITQSHGGLSNGQWVEVIDEQLTPEEIELQRHAAKPSKLKQAENFYISIIDAIPETLEIGLDTTTEIIADKLEAESDKADGVISELQAVKIGLKLQAAISEIERQGGSWYDLPSQPHVIEE